MSSEVRTTVAFSTMVLTGPTRKFPYRRYWGISNRIAVGFFPTEIEAKFHKGHRRRESGLVCTKGGSCFVLHTGTTFVFCLLGLAATLRTVRATSEIIIVGPGAVVAAADSREVVSSYLVNGETVTEPREICKLRRAGSAMAL